MGRKRKMRSTNLIRTVRYRRQKHSTSVNSSAITCLDLYPYASLPQVASLMLQDSLGTTCLASGLFCWIQEYFKELQDVKGDCWTLLFQTASSASCKLLKTKLLSVSLPSSPAVFMGSFLVQQRNSSPFLQTHVTFARVFPETLSLLFSAILGDVKLVNMKRENKEWASKREKQALYHSLVSSWENCRPG